MQAGGFIVHTDPDSREIQFNLAPNYPDPIPEEQLELQEKVSRTLLVVSSLYPDGDDRFALSKASLLGIAQVGLVGPAARPTLALRALSAFRQEIVDLEAGRVKNNYLRVLGRWSLVFLSVGIGGGWLISWAAPDAATAATLMFLVGASAGGVWLSFGARKTILRFDELHVIESDRLEPALRIVFTGGLTSVLGLLLLNGWVEITVGTFKTSALTTSVEGALLVGALAGIGEQALSRRVVREVETLLGDGAWGRN